MKKLRCERCGRLRYENRMREQESRWRGGYLIPAETYICAWGEKSCKSTAKKYRRRLRAEESV